MTFNGKELSAMIKMAICMAAADNKIEEVEKKIVINELRIFGLQGSEGNAILELAEKMETPEALETISNMSTDQKKYVTGYLAAVMGCDGDIDDAEVKVWQFVCSATNCPQMSFTEALEFWKNN